MNSVMSIVCAIPAATLIGAGFTAYPVIAAPQIDRIEVGVSGYQVAAVLPESVAVLGNLLEPLVEASYVSDMEQLAADIGNRVEFEFTPDRARLVDAALAANVGFAPPDATWARTLVVSAFAHELNAPR